MKQMDFKNFKRLSEEKSMSAILSDNQKQRLFDDGVNQQDYVLNKIWYQNCAECNGYFNKDDEIPCLLTCGHVICQECLN